jgi:hypothetical protein
LAARQHGVVAAAQLGALGISPDAISHRISSGRLHPVFRGVYAVGHAAISLEARWLAAVMACGEGALLSHRSAAALWGIHQDAPARVDVSVEAARRNRRGIRIYRPTALLDSDCAQRRGIPLTGVTRTLLDLAAVLPMRKLERAVIEAERLHVLNAAEVLGRCGRGHRGSGRLREIVVRELAPSVAARSELELRFVELCRRFDIPMPQLNVYVEGLLVDAFWPDARLVVELDGHAYHRTPGDGRRDRARDRTLILAGHQVLRFGWEDVTARQHATANAVLDLLARRTDLPSPPYARQT